MPNKYNIYDNRQIASYIEQKGGWFNLCWLLNNEGWFARIGDKLIAEKEIAYLKPAKFVAETKIDIHGNVNEHSTIQKK